MEMTLREMCETLKVTRRAVQGYENAGLICASRKNQLGHLMCDAYSQERIRRIRLFQQLGFTIKEIKEIIDAPNEVLKEALEDRVERLKENKRYMDVLIGRAHELIETL